MGKKIKSLLLWLVFGVLLATGFAQARTIAQFPTMSLRYSTPITGVQAYQARQHAIAQESFWPTFWHQHTSNIRDTQVNSISFAGDGGLVWPATYIAGTVPSSVDRVGVAVSAPLAFELWGSTDIVGMEVEIDQVTRIVRGVFEASQPLALISYHIEDRTPTWTGVELAGGSNHPTRQDAVQFSALAGLGMPDYILMGGAVGVGRAMAYLPLVIPALYALYLVVAFAKGYYPMAKTPILLGCLLALAVATPWLLGLLPYWAIPTHFSDFSFWGNLFSQGNAALREFIAAPATLRDVELTLQLLRQGAVVVGAICISIAICYNTGERK